MISSNASRTNTYLSQIPDLLEWAGTTGPLVTACRAYIAWAFYRLSLWPSSENFAQRLRSLPLPAQQRLLLSPLMQNRLFLSVDPGPSILEMVDLYLKDPASDLPELIAPAELVLSMHSREPLIACSTGAAVTVLPDISFGVLTRPAPEQLERAHRRTQQALELVLAVSPVAYQLISSNLQLVAYVNLPNERQFSSSSHRNIIGRITLGNAHSDFHTVERLADALVHEAVHAALYKLELIEPIFADMQLASDERVTSPWSGRQLSLTSFTHACFVWFALVKFWEVGLAPDRDKDSAAALMYARARNGFAVSESSIQDIYRRAKGVAPHVVPVIEDMWRRVGLAGANDAICSARSN